MERKIKKSRWRGLISYYKPYAGLFAADMIFAIIGAAVTLAIPLIVRYITTDVAFLPGDEAITKIVQFGLLMALLVFVEFGCNFFITYYGHLMGTYMERDLRNEIFEHYQRLSLSFFDSEKVGHLLSRVTADLFDITELLHHGPEDLTISVIKILGSFIILYRITPVLAVTAMIMVIIMAVFAIGMNRKMKKAFAANRARIGDINRKIEDS